MSPALGSLHVRSTGHGWAGPRRMNDFETKSSNLNTLYALVEDGGLESGDSGLPAHLSRPRREGPEKMFPQILPLKEDAGARQSPHMPTIRTGVLSSAPSPALVLGESPWASH